MKKILSALVIFQIIFFNACDPHVNEGQLTEDERLLLSNRIEGNGARDFRLVMEKLMPDLFLQYTENESAFEEAVYRLASIGIKGASKIGLDTKEAMVCSSLSRYLSIVLEKNCSQQEKEKFISLIDNLLICKSKARVNEECEVLLGMIFSSFWLGWANDSLDALGNDKMKAKWIESDVYIYLKRSVVPTSGLLREHLDYYNR